MRLIRSAHFLALLAFAAPIATLAQARQTSVTPEPTGTITGHVFCADTNEPARFAQVSLQAIPAPSTKPAPKDLTPPTDTSGAGKVQTSLDGSFTLSHVKPGSYYVLVDKAGYLGPRDLFTAQELADTSPEMLARRAAAIPHVTVEANHNETAEIRLDRGASVSGTILYDDGTPAGGLGVQILHKDEKGNWVRLEYNGSMNRWNTTDDRGAFRASSLLPGDYIIEADLSLVSSKTQSMKLPGANMTVMVDVQTFNYLLPFYGTGTPHLSEAKPVTLPAGQEIPGQDMMIPIAKLHKLTGRVAAGRDAHYVNAATVSLVSRDDNKELASTDISREDGLFHFEFVPDGDYTLKVTEARDSVWETPAPTQNNPIPSEKERIIATFGDTEEPIILRGDMLGTLATVSPDTVPNASKPGTVNAQNGSQPSTQPDGTSPSATPPPPTDPSATPKAKSTLASTF